MRTLVIFIMLGCAAFINAADEKLPITDCLELWLDAARVNGDQPTPADKTPVAEWRDFSGKNRHARQAKAEARPLFVKVGNDAVVRFDGDNDHLRFVGGNEEARTFTIILVAAP